MTLRRRAMTLVEILVTTAGLAIVAGLALTLYENTQSAAAKMITRQAASDFSIFAMEETTRILHDAIAPSNLAKPESAVAEFKSDRFTVPTFKEKPSDGMVLTSIRPAEKAPPEVYYQRVERPLIASDGGGNPEKIKALVGRSEKFKPVIKFRYAERAKPGEPIAYVDDIDEGHWPALVEVSIHIELKDYPDQPLDLKTSVIPGGLPGNLTAKAGQP